MGEVLDHPNRKKVWPGSGGVYSGKGGFSRIGGFATSGFAPHLRENFRAAVFFDHWMVWEDARVIGTRMSKP